MSDKGWVDGKLCKGGQCVLAPYGSCCIVWPKNIVLEVKKVKMSHSTNMNSFIYIYLYKIHVRHHYELSRLGWHLKIKKSYVMTWNILLIKK